MPNPLCELLAIETPIVQAPMGGAAGPKLAAAVSNAGALGTLGLSWTPVEEIGRLVAGTRAATERPFGVNLVLEWDQHERLAAALDAGAPVVSLTWGDPRAYVEQAHAAGAKTLVTVGSAAEARDAVAAGADAVVAQGWEAGGHVWGGVSTLVLVPVVVDAVDVPVIAAGGIADARGVAAVRALGAAGAWVGTRFLLAEECEIHPVYRDRLLAATETDTFYGTLFGGGWENAPHRVLRNSTVEAWEAAGSPADVLHPALLPLADADGEVEAMSLWAGQSVGLVREVQPAAAIVRELAAGF
jgi:nitronate monooxygenase